MVHLNMMIKARKLAASLLVLIHMAEGKWPGVMTVSDVHSFATQKYTFLHNDLLSLITSTLTGLISKYFTFLHISLQL